MAVQRLTENDLRHPGAVLSILDLLRLQYAESVDHHLSDQERKARLEAWRADARTAALHITSGPLAGAIQDHHRAAMDAWEP
jgi:hypothetical protein